MYPPNARSANGPYISVYIYVVGIINKQIKRRKPLRLDEFEYKGSYFVYHITICTSNKQPYFLEPRIAKVIEDALVFRRNKNEIVLFCYCVMPDHLHILLSLNDTYAKRLQEWVSAFKRYTSKATYELCGIKPLWQKNFFDHVVRKEESLNNIAEYIVNNPVRKGIIEEWEQYPYSRIVDPLC